MASLFKEQCCLAMKEQIFLRYLLQGLIYHFSTKFFSGDQLCEGGACVDHSGETSQDLHDWFHAASYVVT
jgi:hypothetical protein